MLHSDIFDYIWVISVICFSLFAFVSVERKISVLKLLIGGLWKQILLKLDVHEMLLYSVIH
jgi:hypothetical protein